MQLVSSRIWTRVVVSISYDDNHYTTGTFKWYMYKPELFKENEKHKFLMNFEIQTDHQIPAKRPKECCEIWRQR